MSANIADFFVLGFKSRKWFGEEKATLDVGGIRQTQQFWLPMSATRGATTTERVQMRAEHLIRVQQEIRYQAEEVRSRHADLRSEVEALKTRLDRLIAPAVIVLKSLSREDAKKELISFFRKNTSAYPSDAAIELGIDPEIARDLALELESEGLLEAEG